jgi:hypothetical protein
MNLCCKESQHVWKEFKEEFVQAANFTTAGVIKVTIYKWSVDMKSMNTLINNNMFRYYYLDITIYTPENLSGFYAFLKNMHERGETLKLKSIKFDFEFKYLASEVCIGLSKFEEKRIPNYYFEQDY